MQEILGLDKEGWLKEVEMIRDYYKIFGDRLPKELEYELEQRENRLKHQVFV